MGSICKPASRVATPTAEAVTRDAFKDIACESAVADGKLTDGVLEVSDWEMARRLQLEEERVQDEAAEREDSDAAVARLVLQEEREQTQSLDHDGTLAAALQGEHGKAGRMLLRASQLDSFLDAPLYSRPLPNNSDLDPETLRRIVMLTQRKHVAKLSNSYGLETADQRAGRFRIAGSVITGGASGRS